MKDINCTEYLEFDKKVKEYLEPNTDFLKAFYNNNEQNEEEYTRYNNIVEKLKEFLRSINAAEYINDIEKYHGFDMYINDILNL